MVQCVCCLKLSYKLLIIYVLGNLLKCVVLALFPPVGVDTSLASVLLMVCLVKKTFYVFTCLCLQCGVGPIVMEVGRFKAGPFHSERRFSQSSQVS